MTQQSGETRNGVEHDGCPYRGAVVFVGPTRVWFCNKCGQGGPIR